VPGFVWVRPVDFGEIAAGSVDSGRIWGAALIAVQTDPLGMRRAWSGSDQSSGGSRPASMRISRNRSRARAFAGSIRSRTMELVVPRKRSGIASSTARAAAMRTSPANPAKRSRIFAARFSRESASSLRSLCCRSRSDLASDSRFASASTWSPRSFISSRSSIEIRPASATAQAGPGASPCFASCSVARQRIARRRSGSSIASRAWISVECRVECRLELSSFPMLLVDRDLSGTARLSVLASVLASAARPATRKTRRHPCRSATPAIFQARR